MRLRPTRTHPDPEPPPAPALLDDAHHAHVHELVMSARLDDIPLRMWLAPLEVVALERAEADGYQVTS
jgi:hypothetical protein